MSSSSRNGLRRMRLNRASRNPAFAASTACSSARPPRTRSHSAFAQLPVQAADTRAVCGRAAASAPPQGSAHHSAPKPACRQQQTPRHRRPGAQPHRARCAPALRLGEERGPWLPLTRTRRLSTARPKPPTRLLPSASSRARACCWTVRCVALALRKRWPLWPTGVCASPPRCDTLAAGNSRNARKSLAEPPGHTIRKGKWGGGSAGSSCC